MSASLATLLGAGWAAARWDTGEYDELTNTYRSVTNFNVETTRGMHVSASLRVLMINTHGSTLNMWVPGGGLVPQFYWPTINNPIAVDAYTDVAESPDKEYAVVLGGGTHAIALHDLDNGHIVNLLQLPAETGDLVVDQENNRGFASVPGNNTVVQFALPSLELEAVFTVEAQRPRFLWLDLATEEPEDNVVFVTPELSGNNTISLNAFQNTLVDPPAFSLFSGFTFPLDLKPSLPDGLPDDDLFLITPEPPPLGAPPRVAAESVLRNAGTILEAHGRNPVTLDYWIVGTDALNTQEGSLFPTNEPTIRGKFARNQLTIAETLGGSPLPWENEVFDLDLVDVDYDAQYSIAAPYALCFHPSGGAVIAGSTSDQIRAVWSDGVRIGDLELPPGSIPRHLAFDATGSLMFVYCWGTNEVRIYDVVEMLIAMDEDENLIAGPEGGYVVSFDLGADPANEHIRHGRELFYDADNSLDGRTTCSTCHVGAAADGVGWNIQDFPHDHKDLMVTQSLKGIEDTFPYHWRGERDLEAFNAAFAGLLGGSELDMSPAGDFQDFKAFVFSVIAHGNPHCNPRRVLDTTRATEQSAYIRPDGHEAGDPINGQDLMDLPNTLGRFSCADCHGKVAGTIGDISVDAIGPTPTTTQSMDVAHFRQLTHKFQDLVEVDFEVATIPFTGKVPRTGYGFTHDGDHPSVFDFLDRNPFDLDVSEEQDLAAFVEQADEGITPAAHLAWYVDDVTLDDVLDDIGEDGVRLFDQAGITFEESHWLSIAVIGTHEDSEEVPHDLTWYYFPATELFYASDPTVEFPDSSVGTQSWEDLVDQVEEGNATFTLLALPPANALRFSVDPDDDALSTFDEGTEGTDPFDADTDDDGDPDGHEVFNNGDPLDDQVQADDQTDPTLTFGRLDHTGASYIKAVMVFSEPVTLSIEATNLVTGHVSIENRYVPRQWDSITIQRLEASLPGIEFREGHPFPDLVAIPYAYTFEITMTDLSGNINTILAEASIATRDQIVPFPMDPNAEDGPDLPPAGLSRIVEDLAWVGTPGSGPEFEATATVKVRYEVDELADAYLDPPDTPNGSDSPYEKQVVVAQVLFFDSAEGAWSVLPSSGGGLTVSGERLFDEVLLRGDPEGADPDPSPFPMVSPAIIPGPFLLSTPSDDEGDVSFEFELSDTLSAGDKVKLNVIAILEQDGRDDPPDEDNEFWVFSIFAYSMPATLAENRGIVSP